MDQILRSSEEAAETKWACDMSQRRAWPAAKGHPNQLNGHPADILARPPAPPHRTNGRAKPATAAFYRPAHSTVHTDCKVKDGDFHRG